MKKLLLISLLLLNLKSYAQEWEWAKKAGGPNGWDMATAITNDASGNVYITGRFQDSTITFGSYILKSKGSGDIFIVKYNPKGQVVWAKNEGGTDWDVPLTIAIDNTGNIFIAGFFYSPVMNIGSFTLIKNSSIQYGNHDIFIIKYDSQGKVLWAKSAGSNDGEYASGLAIDNFGNCYMTGNFMRQSIVFDNITLTNSGSGDVFLVKYDSGGNIIWAKSAGGTGYDIVNSLCVDLSGNIYIGGGYESPYLTFGNDTLKNSAGNNLYPKSDLFIAKYDSNGNSIGTKSAIPRWNNGENVKALKVDSFNNLYAVGSFEGEMTIDSIKLNGGSGHQMFISKFNDKGICIWAKSSKTSGYSSHGKSLAIDNSDNIYVTGVFASQTIQFDTLKLNNIGGYDNFLVKYNSTGNILLGESFGSTDSDIDGAYVSASSFGDVYVCGGFKGHSIQFGSKVLMNSDTTNGNSDMFIAKLSYHYETPEEIPDKELSIPNIFTPNGDGTNDVFTISNLPEGSSFEIYNRWGVKQYASSELSNSTINNNSWDGRTTSGQECPEGVYYYIATLPDKTLKGFVHLLR